MNSTTNSNSPLTFCISTYNNLEYLKLAVKSVRKYSSYKKAPFVIHAENCTDGTKEWLNKNSDKYNLFVVVENNDPAIGIGGGMNRCAEFVETEYIMFLHSDFVVAKNWDVECIKIAKKMDEDQRFWISSHRVEPRIFPKQETRPGTVVYNKEAFGAYHDDFKMTKFQQWAEGFRKYNDFTIPKGEGVSGLIRKRDWDYIGGNDPRFAPSSFDDMDLFLRMQQENFKFILTSKSVVFHFGARGSHRLEENDGKSSKRQQKAERANRIKWLEKWGSAPKFDDYGMIIGLEK